MNWRLTPATGTSTPLALGDQPRLVATNKIRCARQAGSARPAASARRADGRGECCISAVTGAGVPALLDAMWREVARQISASGRLMRVGYFGGTISIRFIADTSTWPEAAHRALSRRASCLRPGRCTAAPSSPEGLGGPPVRHGRARPRADAVFLVGPRDAHGRPVMHVGHARSAGRAWRRHARVLPHHPAPMRFADSSSWKDYPAILDQLPHGGRSRPAPPGAGASGHAAVDRPSDDPGRPVERHTAARRSNILLVNAPTAPVSSTGVRRRNSARSPQHGLVPDAVEEYNQKHGLYVEHA